MGAILQCSSHKRHILPSPLHDTFGGVQCEICGALTAPPTAPVDHSSSPILPPSAVPNQRGLFSVGMHMGPQPFLP